jgi:hypothetical protein
MVQASQFCGKAHEDASAHLQHFLEICSTFTIKEVPKDTNKERNTTWNNCSTAFLAKFFPTGKTNAIVLKLKRM